MPRKMSGIAMITIDESMVASRTPAVVLVRATHLYRSSAPCAGPAAVLATAAAAPPPPAGIAPAPAPPPPPPRAKARPLPRPRRLAGTFQIILELPRLSA